MLNNVFSENVQSFYYIFNIYIHRNIECLSIKNNLNVNKNDLIYSELSMYLVILRHCFKLCYNFRQVHVFCYIRK